MSASIVFHFLKIFLLCFLIYFIFPHFYYFIENLIKYNLFIFPRPPAPLRYTYSPPPPNLVFFLFGLKFTESNLCSTYPGMCALPQECGWLLPEVTPLKTKTNTSKTDSWSLSSQQLVALSWGGTFCLAPVLMLRFCLAEA